MGWIPEEKLEEIKNQASIVSVISQYVNLKKAGINYKGLCPFHSERTPSFVVSEAKRIYHCFGCGKGGNVFTFLQDHARLSFPEAVQKLASELRILLPSFPRDKEQKQTKEKKELLYKINKLALMFFKEQLLKSSRAAGFLKKRGVTPETISLFHLGYAPAGWQALSDFLKRKSISEKHLLEIGLIVERSSGRGYYDRFRDRIIFPLLDLSQRVIGFGGRSLDEEVTPKYLNSIESPIYHKGRELYGLFQVLRKSGSFSERGVIIVEGYFDCILLSQSGFKNVVATMGTALSKEHLGLLKRFTDRFYLFFDGDEAGKEASERSLSLFLEAGIFPKIVECPPGIDPDDVVRNKPREFLIEKIKKSRSLIDFVTDRVIGRSENLVSSRSKVVHEMIPYLKKISVPIEREGWVKRLSDRLQIDEKWVWKPLEEEVRGGFAEPPGLKRQSLDSEMRFEQAGVEVELLEFFALFPIWLSGIELEKILDLLSDLEVKQIALEMMSQFRQSQAIDFPSLIEKIGSSELKERFVKGVLQKENQGRSEQEWRQIYEACLKRLRKNHLEIQQRRLLEDIRAIEMAGGPEQERNDLLNRYQRLVKQKQQFTKS